MAAPRYALEPQARGQLMAALALAWDGQWFLKVKDRFGYQAAAELNARVRASFGRLEMRFTLRALGKESAEDLEDALEVWRAYVDAFDAGRGAFAGTQAVQGSTLRVSVTRCAAWEGAKRAGLEGTTQACVACETLWKAWFGALLPGREVSQQVLARMGFGDPACRFTVGDAPKP